MDSLVLKPKFFSASSVLFLIAAFLVTGILAITIWPRLYELYTINPTIPEIWQVFVGTSAAIFMVWMIYFISLVASLGKKIVIDNTLVYFRKRKSMGFGAWKTEHILNFSKVTEVTQREQRVFNGKMMVIYYWLIFHMGDKSKQEILLNNWDMSSMRELFLYMKGRHSNIKFDTVVLRDSPERISGIDEYLKKIKK